MIVGEVEELSNNGKGLNNKVVLNKFENNDFIDLIDSGVETGISVFITNSLHGVHESMQFVNIN